MDESFVVVEGLTKYFGERCAVNQVSFSVHPGEVVALLGRNGAGKTTLMRMLVGELCPSRGHSRLFDCDSQRLTPEALTRVAYLPEGNRVYGWMSVEQLAKFTARTHPRWKQSIFNGLTARFGLESSSKASSLSTGQRAQLALAIGLACEPDLLILDDPTVHVDAAVRRDFLRGIVALVGELGRTVLLTSHVLSDIERVADRIMVMENGVLRVDATPDGFKAGVGKYQLLFDDDAPPVPAIPRLVSKMRAGRVLTLVVARPDVATEQNLSRLGARSCERIPLSLEDSVR